MGQRMPILDASSLSKSLGTRTLLKNAHLTIVRGEKVGLVGDNGSGKSTLGKILAGVAEPDGGTVTRRRGARISYLEQEPQFPAGKNARETALSGLLAWNKAHERYQTLCTRLELAQGSEASDLLAQQATVTAEIERLGGWDRSDEATRILTQLKITDLEKDVATMSGGERRRVALARLLIERPDLAILDEPTNHLDAEAIEWLETFLTTRFSAAVLLITHDRYLLNNVVARTVEIEGGNLYSYSGGWEEFLSAREERRTVDQRTESNRQNFLRREIEWLRRSPKARTGKQKARIGRAEAALTQSAPTKKSNIELSMESGRLGGNILEARALSVRIGERTLVRKLDFHLTRKERVGIVGKSGAGKTTLLRTLLGEHAPHCGEVVRGKNTTFAYLDQMRTDAPADETVFDAVTGGRPSVRVGETDFSSYSYLKRFRFEGETLRQKVGGLSGGEKSRLALARLMLTSANVLVLDEPTNDLDVMTLSALEDMLIAWKGAALVVSHDRYFLDRVATSILALDGKGGVQQMVGGYREFADARKASLETSPEAVRASSSREPSRPESAPANRKKLTYAEEIELSGLYPKVEEATESVRALEEKLADPTLYNQRRDEAAAIERNIFDARARLEQLEKRWLELEEKKQG